VGFGGVHAAIHLQKLLARESAVEICLTRTAQHAMREGNIVAQNIAVMLLRRPLKSFSFKTIGLLASIGRRIGVARIFGFDFSGSSHGGCGGPFTSASCPV